METVAQKALRLLSPIPHTQFISNDFTDGKNKCCVIGHYMRLTSDNPNDYSFGNCSDGFESDLRTESVKFLGSMLIDISNVNNNLFSYQTHKYIQKRCKSRVIAFLKDMIKGGY